jgi:hypothetical protein
MGLILARRNPSRGRADPATNRYPQFAQVYPQPAGRRPLHGEAVNTPVRAPAVDNTARKPRRDRQIRPVLSEFSARLQPTRCVPRMGDVTTNPPPRATRRAHRNGV